MRFLIWIVMLCPLASAQETHKFFDRQNVALFTGIAVTRTLDLHSTWRFRSHGKHEVVLSDGFVDNKPAFSAFSAAMVGGHIAGCYLLHRAGHHRWERVVSYIHFGAMAGTVVNNYRH